MIWLGVENTQWTQAAAYAISRGRRSVERSVQVVSAAAVIRRLRGWRRSLRRRGTLPAVFPSPEPPCRSSTPWQRGAENDSNGPIV